MVNEWLGEISQGIYEAYLREFTGKITLFEGYEN